MRKHLLSVTAVSLMGSAGADLIINGDFESSVPRNGSGNGWTSASVNGLGGWRSTGGVDNSSWFILNDNGSFDDPVISQEVTVATTGVYMLSGQFRSAIVNSSPASDTDSFEVLVDGTVVFQSGPTPLDGSFNAFSVLLNLTGGEEVTISFAAEANGSDNDFGIDNISLVLVPTPTGACVLIAGAALAARRRR